MRLYLDDDSVDALLVMLLRRAGYEVQIPADVGKSGECDSVHFAQAIHDNRMLLSRNHDDFKNLHDLIMEAKGHHPGVLIVRRDNDPSRDLKPAGIVRALRNFEAAGVRITDDLHILNHWR
jgi:predicted nuclease of predicted toxin-antitoxin system